MIERCEPAHHRLAGVDRGANAVIDTINPHFIVRDYHYRGMKL